MGVVSVLVRTELRRRWRALLLVVVLVGIAAGTAMWAAGAARRTATTFERLAHITNAEDVLVNPDDGYTPPAPIEALEQVADSCGASGAPVLLAGPDREPAFDEPVLPLATDGRCMLEIGGPARVDGRLPDLDEPYEVFLSASATDLLDAQTGETIDAFVFADFEAEPEPIELSVTGSGVFASDALLDPENEATFPLMVLTPAFSERHPVDPEETFAGVLVKLHGGEDDVADFIASARATAGEPMHFEDRFENERNASRALEPYALALWLFAAGVVVAGGGLLGVALHRALAASRDDVPTLDALGVPARTRAIPPLLLGVVGGLVAAAIAAVTATLLSPLAPVGPARDIEPNPGVRIDGVVLLVGVAATCLFSFVVAALAVATSRRREQRVVRSRSIVPLASASPSQVAGARLATGALGGARSGATSTVVGAVLGVVAVLVVEVVGAGIGRLVDDPERYGWDWDVMINVFEEDYGPAVGPVYRELLNDLDEAGVTERTTVAMNQLDIAGATVAALGIRDTIGAPVVPTLLVGRVPRRDREILLGATTADRAGVAVGDAVRVRSGDQTRDMTVVGISTFPRLTEYPGAPATGLGDGAITTGDALVELTGALPYAAVIARADDDVLEEVREHISEVDSIDASVQRVERPQRPDALYGYETTAPLRHVLGALLGVLAVVSVGLGLSTSARSARRDLAVLRTVGMTRSQARAVVHTHGALVGLATLVLGLPLGIVAGRLAWRTFAERIGVADDPFVPIVAVTIVGAAAIATCLLLSTPIARLSTRRAPAPTLRSE